MMSRFEPRREKTGLWGFRPGPTQTELYSHRRWLERKKKNCTIFVAKTKAVISCAVLNTCKVTADLRLCFFCICKKQAVKIISFSQVTKVSNLVTGRDKLLDHQKRDFIIFFRLITMHAT